MSTDAFRTPIPWVVDCAVATPQANDLAELLRYLSTPFDEDLTTQPAGLDDSELPQKSAYLTTRSHRLLAKVLVPLVHSLGLSQRSHTALIVGNTNAGVAETVRQLKLDSKNCSAYTTISLGAVSQDVARYFGLKGPVWTVSTACTAGAKAIMDGVRMLRSQQCECALVAGVDVASPLTEAGFLSLGAKTQGCSRPFDQHRTGMHLGEGAAAMTLMLSDKRFAREHLVGSDRLGHAVAILGMGESSDAHHISAPHPQGEGALQAMHSALLGAQSLLGAPVRPDFMLLHGTGTRQNDDAESVALKRLGLDQIACASIKARLGHTLGAAGALNAAVAVGLIDQTLCLNQSTLPLNFACQACKDPAAPSGLTGPDRHTMPVRTVLSNAFAFGGNNATIIFGA